MFLFTLPVVLWQLSFPSNAYVFIVCLEVVLGSQSMQTILKKFFVVLVYVGR